MPTATLSAPIQSPLLTIPESASYTRMPEKTLERMRSTGAGPTFVKAGRRVLYRLADLDAWIEQQRRAHTSASMPPAA